MASRWAGLFVGAALAVVLLGTVPADAGTPKPRPVVDSFSYYRVLRGDSVEIVGENFTGATSVKFNGQSSSFTVDDDQEIGAVVPKTATSGFVSVTTKSGTGVSPEPIHVIVPPRISSFKPATGGQNTIFRIHGTGLDDVDTVTLGGQQIWRLSYGDHGLLPAEATHPVTGKLVVSDDGGTSPPSSGTFTVVPGIDSVDPDVGIPGDTFAINGSKLTGATDVRLDGKSIPFTVDDDWTIQTTAGDHFGAGKLTVYRDGKTLTSGCCFARIVHAPAATPGGSGPAAVGAIAHVEPGEFVPHLAVRFPGLPPAPVVFVTGDSPRLDSAYFVVPEGAHTVHLRYTNPIGDGPPGDQFVVSPRVGSFAPTEGPPGSTVEITETTFTGAREVVFNDDTAASFTVVDDSTIDAVVPSGTDSGHITVVTCTGDHAAQASYERTDARFRITYGGTLSTPPPFVAPRHACATPAAAFLGF